MPESPVVYNEQQAFYLHRIYVFLHKLNINHKFISNIVYVPVVSTVSQLQRMLLHFVF